MSMNILYSFREGLLGMRRARFATMLTISTLTISMTLLGVFLIFTANIRFIVENFRKKIAIEVFIDHGLQSQEIAELGRQISEVHGVEEAVYISPQDALNRMGEELGKDLIDLLGTNPLPASYQVKLIKDQRSLKGIENVAQNLEKMKGVDDVIYHGKVFQLVDRYSHAVLVIDGVLFLIVLFSSIFLVANTLRLTILAHKQTILIMDLVGATTRFIRRPYIIQGVLQGGVGGVIATVVVWGVLKGIGMWFPNLLIESTPLILTPLLLGVVLGYLGSRLGLRRFLKNP